MTSSASWPCAPNAGTRSGQRFRNCLLA